MRDRRGHGSKGGRDGIPREEAAALRGYLERRGMAADSARGLVEALAIDLADGVPESLSVHAGLVRAATEEAGTRALAGIARIRRLADATAGSGAGA